MNKPDLIKLQARIFEECLKTAQAGQKEYALSEDAFENFNTLATELNLDRKVIWLVYFSKHRSGITSYIKGHKSQREDVRGRIKDAIVYLTILWGMIEEEEVNNPI